MKFNLNLLSMSDQPLNTPEDVTSTEQPDEILVGGFRLLESNGDGSKWRVCVIEEGLSNNGYLYLRESFPSAIEVFTGKNVAMYGFNKASADHIPIPLRFAFPAGLARNFVGWIDNLGVEEVVSTKRSSYGQRVQAVVADLHVTDGWLKDTLREAWSRNKRDMFEVSIEAGARPDRGNLYRSMYKGRMVPTVKKFDSMAELTIVGAASAGGAVLNIAASDCADTSRFREFLVEALEAEASNLSETLKDQALQMAQALRESMDSEKSGECCSECVEHLDAAKKALSTGDADAAYTSLHDAMRMLFAYAQSKKSEKRKETKLMESDQAATPEPAAETVLRESVTDVTEVPAEAKPEVSEPKVELATGAEAPVARQPEVPLRESVTAPKQPQEDRMSDSLAALNSSAPNTSAVVFDHERAQQQEHERCLRESRRTLSYELDQSNLPQHAKEQIRNRIIARIDSGEVVSEAFIRESVSQARDLLEPVLATRNETPASSALQLAGNSRVVVGAEEVDRRIAQFDRCVGFDGARATERWERDPRTGRGRMVTLTESQRDVYRNLPPMVSLQGWFADVFNDPVNYGFGNSGYAQASPLAEMLREATRSDIPHLLGDSMTRQLIARYRSGIATWRDICTVVPVANFRTQRRLLFGGLGILPVVTESDIVDNYQPLGLPADEERTYAVETRGGVARITRRMVIDDDLQALRRMPEEIGDAAAMTLAGLVFNYLQARSASNTINSDTSYTGNAIYHVNHGNLGVTAFGYQSLIDARNRLRRQRKFGNVGALGAAISNTSDTNITLSVSGAGHNQLRIGVKVGDTIQVDAEQMLVVATTGSSANDITVARGYNGTTAATHSNSARVEQLGPQIVQGQIRIIHPIELDAAVNAVLRTEKLPGSLNNDINVLYEEARNGRLVNTSVHEMYLSGNMRNWYLVAGSPFEVGFLQGREDPEMFLQDNPLIGDNFLRDTMTYKARHEYGMQLLDHKLVDGNLVP